MLRATTYRLSLRTSSLGLACIIAVLGLVWVAWPRHVDTYDDVLRAYAQLEQSPAPVRVVGWIVPSEARVQLLPDGYILSLRAQQLGDLTISGRRGGVRLSSAALTWQEGDVTYGLETAADPRLVQPRVVPLDEARRQLTGSAVDTPVLYLGYLPVFAVFAAWATASLLLGHPAH